MRFSVVILIALFFSVGCQKQGEPNSAIKVLGHGGEGFSHLNSVYPPNSVMSLKRALEVYRLDGVEVDVRFLADSSLIVFHDKHLETASQCKGLVSGATRDQAVGCFYRDQYQNAYTEQIISMDSLIVLLNSTWTESIISIQVQTEINDNVSLKKLARRYAASIVKINNLYRISTECNNANFLFYLREFGDFESHLVAPISTDGVNDVYRFGLQGIVSRFDERSDKLEKQLKDSGIHITLYGQKISKDYTNWDYKYIDAVQVDNPIQALKFFKNK